VWGPQTMIEVGFALLGGGGVDELVLKTVAAELAVTAMHIG
jgi:hypothetical protein